MTSDGEVATQPLACGTVPEGALVGTPVSSGVAEGLARVIRDPSSALLEKGEILVGPYCDPGWTPLFLNAAGMVTEVGGMMTHGSLVARIRDPGRRLGRRCHDAHPHRAAHPGGTRGIVEILG